MIKWNFKSISEITEEELEEVIALHKQDFTSYHIIYPNEHDFVLGYNEKDDLIASVTIGVENQIAEFGHVIVDSQYRASGLGSRLLEVAIAYAETKWSIKAISLEALKNVVGFYKTQGFDIAGEEKVDNDGDTVVPMQLEI